MGHKTDDTLRDDGRREIALTTGLEVKKYLPEYFKTDYPKITSFLEEYYHFEDSDVSPSRLVNDLFYTRDINQVDTELLKFIEDELLLGQSFFEGFIDKRTAAKFSNNLYRSKGTKFSIQQFFRMFFGVDVEIIYTKKDVFRIGTEGSEIGAESVKFLTNAELFQQFAIKIISELPIKTWQRPYKLFVHPAGMFIGSEVRLLGQSFFEGFIDKRTAAKFSNNLYRSKGTKFSIQQFFRMFFGVDVEIIYTKKDVFRIGTEGSEIGAESVKFLTNAELFQQFAIKIISELPIKTGQRPYKLFVHPAGMFIGSEVRLEGIVNNQITAPDSLVDSDVGTIDVVGTTEFTFDNVVQCAPEITGIARDSADSDGIFKRVIIDDNFLVSLQNTSIVDIQKQYETLRAAELRTSPTFDADSTGLATSVNIDFSNANN